MNQQQPTLRSELRQFWRIGWPLLVAQTAQMGTGVVDTIMAARFGDKDLAAIAIGFNIWLPLYLVILGVIFASSTIIAQDFGAGRMQRIRDQLPQSLWVSVFLSVIVAPSSSGRLGQCTSSVQSARQRVVPGSTELWPSPP